MEQLDGRRVHEGGERDLGHVQGSKVEHLDGLQGHGGRVRGSEQVHGPGPELPPAKVRRSAEGLDELERALEKKMVEELLQQVTKPQKENKALSSRERVPLKKEDGNLKGSHQCG